MHFHVLYITPIILVLRWWYTITLLQDYHYMCMHVHTMYIKHKYESLGVFTLLVYTICVIAFAAQCIVDIYVYMCIVSTKVHILYINYYTRRYNLNSKHSLLQHNASISTFRCWEFVQEVEVF